MASMQRMNQLLSWATQNQQTPSDPDYVPPRPLGDIDPGLVDMILGKPDAIRMKVFMVYSNVVVVTEGRGLQEAMAVASDEGRSEEQRVQALDDLELLIESLDNANDMETTKIWDPLLALVDSPSSEIATQALWVAGTAIQNNPKSQYAFLSHNPLPRVISALNEGSSAEVRAKAMYCLSGALKHNRAAVVKFSEAQGWIALKRALEDSSVQVRRKAAFLLNTLLRPDSEIVAQSAADTSDLTRAGITLEDILSTLTSSILSPRPSSPASVPDVDYEEKALRTIVTYLDGHPSDKVDVQDDVRRLLDLRTTERGLGWGLEAADWATLEKSAAAGGA